MQEFKSIFKWMEGQQLKVLGALVATACGIIFSTLIPFVSQTAIDMVIKQTTEGETDNYFKNCFICFEF